MHITVRGSVSALALGLAAGTFAGAAIAQTTGRDGIGDLLKRPADATQLAQSQAGSQKAVPGAHEAEIGAALTAMNSRRERSSIRSRFPFPGSPFLIVPTSRDNRS